MDALGVDQVAIIVGTPRFYRAGPSAASFGVPDWRRVRLAAMRLWRPASARARPPGKPRRRRCSCTSPRKGAASAWRTRCGPIDCRTRARYARRQHDAGLRGRRARLWRCGDDACEPCNCTRITLLTNNPAKLDGAAKAGIEIAARVPLEAPINSPQQALPDDESSTLRAQIRYSGRLRPAKSPEPAMPQFALSRMSYLVRTVVDMSVPGTAPR